MLVLVVPAPAAVTSAGGDPAGVDAEEHRGHHRALAMLVLVLFVLVLWLVMSDPSRPAP